MLQSTHDGTFVYICPRGFDYSLGLTPLVPRVLLMGTAQMSLSSITSLGCRIMADRMEAPILTLAGKSKSASCL